MPPTVVRVNINGVEGERRYVSRSGYYDIKTGRYLPIYDGDKLEVVKIATVDEKDMKMASESEEKWLRDRRIEDMIDNGGKALSNLPEDMELQALAQEEIKQRKEIRDSSWLVRR